MVDLEDGASFRFGDNDESKVLTMRDLRIEHSHAGGKTQPDSQKQYMHEDDDKDLSLDFDSLIQPA